MPIHEYRPDRVVAGVVFMVIGVAFFLESLDVWRMEVDDLWPLLLIAFGTRVLVGRARRKKVEEDRSEQLAVAEERVRIARELHDIVAHGVSLMTIQIAAARRVHKSQPEKADQALAAAEDTGRQSLAELRSMLAMLRGADASIGAAHHPPADSDHLVRPNPNGRAPLPRLEDVERLVAGLRDAGRDVRLTVSGVQPRMAPGVDLAVYRVMQEALTNAVRHAGPNARIDVELTFTPDEVIIFVDDDGAGTTAAARGEGHGLLGMRERVAAVGGDVEAGPRSPGPGWRVRARIPLLDVMA